MLWITGSTWKKTSLTGKQTLLPKYIETFAVIVTHSFIYSFTMPCVPMSISIQIFFLSLGDEL